MPRNLKRVLVCIDSANVAIGLRNYGLSLDYKEFIERIKRLSNKVLLYYYGPKFNNDLHQRFLTFLKKLGFKLRTKEVKVHMFYQVAAMWQKS